MQTGAAQYAFGRSAKLHIIGVLRTFIAHRAGHFEGIGAGGLPRLNANAAGTILHASSHFRCLASDHTAGRGTIVYFNCFIS